MLERRACLDEENALPRNFFFSSPARFVSSFFSLPLSLSSFSRAGVGKWIYIYGDSTVFRTGNCFCFISLSRCAPAVARFYTADWLYRVVGCRACLSKCAEEIIESEGISDEPSKNQLHPCSSSRSNQDETGKNDEKSHVITARNADMRRVAFLLKHLE